MKIESACAYIRVSTSTEDQLNSFENQKDYFEDYTKNNNFFKLHKIYADKGLTATSFKNRPAFNEMLYDAGIDVKPVTVNGHTKDAYFASDRKPKFTYILCKNTSRFARNILSIDIIRELRLKGVYVYYMSINKSTKDMSDDFLITLLTLLDEQESKDKSDKVQFGIMQSAKKGIITGGGNLFGYRLIKGETPSGNKLVTIKEEAEIVKFIFQMYSKGYGVRVIGSELRKNNMLTRKDKPFGKSSIVRILGNQKYMGVLVRNKYETGKVLSNKHYPKLKPKSEWIYHKDANIEPIISEELFKKCEEIRERRLEERTFKTNKKQTKYHKLIVCGKCGKNYVSNMDRGRRFYVCGTKKSLGRNECDNINISEKSLDQKINYYINNTKKENDRINFYISVLEGYIIYLNEKIDIDKDVTVKNKTNELEKLNNKLGRLKELYMDGDIDKDDYTTKKEVIVSNIDKLKNEILNIDKYNHEFKIEKDTSEKMISELKSFDINKITTKEDFFNKLKFIEIYDKKLVFEFFITKKQKDFIIKCLKILGS